MKLTAVMPMLDEIELAIRTICTLEKCEVVGEISVVSGATDNLYLHFQHFSKVTFRHASGSSIYGAIEIGVMNAKYDYIYVCGTGDCIKDLCFSPDVLTIGNIKTDGGRIIPGFRHLTLFRNPIHHQAAVYPKSIISFDQNLKILADMDLNFDIIINKKIEIKFCNNVFNHIAPHGASNNIYRSVKEAWYIYTKHRLKRYFPGYLILLFGSRIK